MMFVRILPKNIFQISVRSLGGQYSAHDFDHAPQKAGILRPVKPLITIPVPVQERALKRHRNIKNIARELDREKLRDKPLVISARRKELNHRLGQTYGRFDKLPLISSGWYHRKSFGDHFTINPFQPMGATNFTKAKEGDLLSKGKDGVPTFSDYALEPGLINALAKCGFTKTTNIQHEAIPKVLDYPDHHSLIAAETGNGKTLAFLVPILDSILRLKAGEKKDTAKNNTPWGVIVTPGRELADQIGDVAKSLCHELGLRVMVCKGSNIRKQLLHGARVPVDLVVGSLGGMSKLFHQGYLHRDRVANMAIDEIDTMLDDTFKDELLRFLRGFGHSGQSIISGVNISMAGATFPTNFDNYLGDIMDTEDILKVSTDNIHKMLYHVHQKFVRVAPTKKTEALLDLLDKDVNKKNRRVVIFSNKTSTSDFVHKFLMENNINCVNFNGGRDPMERRENLDLFLTGEVRVVSATDLMSRGLDTSTVTHVINYDFPLNPADYIHRVGRVGRVGGVKDGHVTSLVCNAGEAKVLENLETAVRKNVEIHAVNNNIIRIIQHRAKYRDSE